MEETKYTFKELDLEGEETLKVISEADLFNEWMFQTIKPYCKGKILEIGSGIGNISRYFLDEKKEILLSDIRNSYVEYLRQNFADKPSLLGVEAINLIHPDFETEYKSFIGTFDTVFALNVVEHIEDDLLAIKNCKLLLKDGGRLIILVPAFQFLFNRLDQELYHYRRYSLKRLLELFKHNDFKIRHTQYFNMAGILGWFMSGRLQQNKTIPKGQMKLYNKLVPVFKLLDRVTFRQIGLSVIAVGEK